MLLELGHDRGYVASSPHGPFRYNLKFIPFRSPVGVISPGGLGIVDEFPYWNSVFELYRRDDVTAAFGILDKIGIGIYGDYATAGDIVYLEAATNDESEIIRINEHLEVECIVDQLPFEFDSLGHPLETAYSMVRQAFGVAAPEVDTMLTLLLKDAVIPSEVWKAGYFTPKTPYGKICLPMPQEEKELLAGFTRGLIYQFAFEISLAQAELWLLEACTVLTANGNAGEAPARWLQEGELNLALGSPDSAVEGSDRLASAKSQARRIGLYLLAHGGEAEMIHLLHTHAECARQVAVGRIAERALKEVYGLGLGDLFEEARVARYPVT